MTEQLFVAKARAETAKAWPTRMLGIHVRDSGRTMSSLAATVSSFTPFRPMPKFIVCFQRPQGEARTYALGADDALKFADGIEDSEEGIMVESVENGDAGQSSSSGGHMRRLDVEEWVTTSQPFSFLRRR